jgi:TolA-binding protein
MDEKEYVKGVTEAEETQALGDTVIDENEPTTPQKKKSKKPIIAVILILVLGGMGFGGYQAYTYHNKMLTYNQAMELFNSGSYTDAAKMFEGLSGFKDSSSMVSECTYQNAVALLSQGNYTDACEIFTSISGYKDSADQITKCKYTEATDLFSQAQYKAACDIFTGLGEYEDAPTQAIECKYNLGKQYYDSRDYENAVSTFNEISEKRDVSNELENSKTRLKYSKIDSSVLESASKTLDDYIDCIEFNLFDLGFYEEHWYNLDEDEEISVDKFNFNGSPYKILYADTSCEYPYQFKIETADGKTLSIELSGKDIADIFCRWISCDDGNSLTVYRDVTDAEYEEASAKVPKYTKSDVYKFVTEYLTNFSKKYDQGKNILTGSALFFKDEDETKMDYNYETGVYTLYLEIAEVTVRDVFYKGIAMRLGDTNADYNYQSCTFYCKDLGNGLEIINIKY